MNSPQDEKLDEILERLNTMHGKLFGMTGDNGFVGETEETLSKIDERLDKLENWRSYLAGAWAVLAGFIGYQATGKH